MSENGQWQLILHHSTFIYEKSLFVNIKSHDNNLVFDCIEDSPDCLTLLKFIVDSTEDKTILFLAFRLL